MRLWAPYAYPLPDIGSPQSPSLPAPFARPADRLRGYTLRVGVLPPSDPNHFTQSAVCYTTAGSQSSSTQYYTCTPSLTGRYVSLRIDGRAEALNIAEVQVYGTLLAPGTSYVSAGCFVDNSNRMVGTLLDNSYGASITVDNCASLAASKGFSVFSLQNGGE